MDKKQYNNIIDWTLQNQPETQTEDSLTAVRAVCDNMGVALPQGDLAQVAETLATDDYMYWHSCTPQEAREAADNGIPTIGIGEDSIVLLAATDKEQPVTTTATVMTLANYENSNITNTAYYSYGSSTTTTTIPIAPSIPIEPTIPVQSITMCDSTYTMNVGENAYLSYSIHPANATNKSVVWCSSNSEIISIDSETGQMIGKACGNAVITVAMQENTSISVSCVVWCDRFLYELIHTLGFTEENAKLIRSLYDKVEEKFSSKTSTYQAWICSRLIGGICYGNETSGMNAQFKWNDVAGKVFSGSEEDFFVNTLNFTTAEYTQLVNAIKTQHTDTSSPDFAHMQISLAARLAYKLNLDGFISNIGTSYSDEIISYLAGWLGDATITNSQGLTSFDNDDYCADLDAENIYRAIVAERDRTIIEATNVYYNSLNSQNTRADVFLSYICVDTVKNMVFAAFGIEDEDNPIDVIKNSYPDTYDFLCSLSDNLENIEDY